MTGISWEHQCESKIHLGGLGQKKFDILALKEGNHGKFRHLVWFVLKESVICSKIACFAQRYCGLLSKTAITAF